MAKFCNQCGSKLEAHHKFCPECGAKINVSKSSKSGADSNQNISAVNGKTLNPKIVYGILIGGVAVIALILLSSGMLDSSGGVVSSVNQNEQQSATNSGVNLNSLQVITELEEKVKQNPNDYQSLLELAHLKNDSGLFEAAIQNYKTYLEKNPADADARVDMGVCYFNLRDYPNAIKEMETALKYEPKHQIAHLNLGVVNLSAGNLSKSKEWLQKAYDLNPTNEIGQKAEQLLKNH
ncbi:MAG: tetratricopeptide repeat protein [Ignavibacteriota bacterium]|nr:zinc-ribbon domain-containing protein [Ignavibacteriota bacterium]MBW7843267.1 tetratricopeptide repeat protein [Ignavibacterium sp.]MCO6447827.1 tetratricopeptide repeat protein [Ignavibacterium album]MCZ2269241.1 tetratricopeptide repeat protein [Ignavibacteriales bacterium]HOJ06577.1 tetratricopeptide repeat protein [Ignavibacteriaceae bacterium]